MSDKKIVDDDAHKKYLEALEQRLIDCLKHPHIVQTIMSSFNTSDDRAALKESMAAKLKTQFANVVPHLLYDLSLPAGSPNKLYLNFEDSSDTRQTRVTENAPNHFSTVDEANFIILNRWQMLGFDPAKNCSRIPDKAFAPAILSLLSIYEQNIMPRYRDIDVEQRKQPRRPIEQSTLPDDALEGPR